MFSLPGNPKKEEVMRVVNRYPGRPRSQGSISFVCDIDSISGYVLKSDSSLKTLHAHKKIDGSSRRQRLMEEPVVFYSSHNQKMSKEGT